MQSYRGTLSLIDDDTFDNIAYPQLIVPTTATIPLSSLPHFKRHITVLTADEYKNHPTIKDTHILSQIEKPKIYLLGLGKAEESYYEVVGSASLQKLRAELNLPWKDLHITLALQGRVDWHDCSKGPDTLLHDQSVSDGQARNILECLEDHWNQLRTDKCLFAPMVAFSIQLLSFALEHTSEVVITRKLLLHRALLHFSQKSFLASYSDCLEAISISHVSASLDTAHTRLADVARKLNYHHIALAAYWKALLISKDPDVVKYCLNHLHELWRQSICSLEMLPSEAAFITFTSDELQQYRQQRYSLAKPLSSIAPNFIEPRFKSTLSDGSTLKRNFSWLIPFFLAGMSTPKSQDDIIVLKNIGIQTIITLTEEEPLPSQWFSNDIGVRNIFWPVSNYFPPYTVHADRFIQLLIQAIYDTSGDKRGILVHCGGGKGRAGSLLAAFLVRYGLTVPPKPCRECRRQPAVWCLNTDCAYGTPPTLPPKDAIDLLRSIRPGSIETRRQEDFVAAYSSLCYKRLGMQSRVTAVLDDSADSNGQIRLIHGDSGVKPSFVLLTGLPASGKSWFADHLATKKNWIRISQDECLGSRRCTETELCNAITANKCIILDRVNPTAEDRNKWLAMAGYPADAVIVHFNASTKTCLQRAQQRLDHPTLLPHMADTVIKSFSKSFQLPEKTVYNVAAVYQVSSFADSRELLRHFGVTIAEPIDMSSIFFKYPRTRHLLDIGGAGRDDLLLSSTDAELFLRQSAFITIEEKVDGANFGIRYNVRTKEMQCQNRSHFVNPKSHVQFSKINSFITNNYESLYELLSGGDLILYGEWLAAQHSVSYDNLPDYFLAFDIFDCFEQKFFSRSRFYECMSHTKISHVQSVYKGTAGELITPEILMELIHKPSFYSNKGNLREGIILRSDDADSLWLLDKVKVVRGDFIAGDEHWSKGLITLNSIISKKYDI